MGREWMEEWSVGTLRGAARLSLACGAATAALWVPPEVVEVEYRWQFGLDT